MKSQTGKNVTKINLKQSKNTKSQKQKQITLPIKSNDKKAKMIITKCLQQNNNFQKWYHKKNWQTFHSSHYDWWAFPIDEVSSHGQTYMVKNQQIHIMKNSKQFMEALQNNAKMVCEAWGYDLIKGEKIKTQHKDQTWQNWPIRLYKMTKSLQIFGLQNCFKNAVKYGSMLIKEGKKFTYNKKELSKYFLEKHNILFNSKIQETKIKKEQENKSSDQQRINDNSQLISKFSQLKPNI